MVQGIRREGGGRRTQQSDRSRTPQQLQNQTGENEQARPPIARRVRLSRVLGFFPTLVKTLLWLAFLWIVGMLCYWAYGLMQSTTVEMRKTADYWAKHGSPAKDFLESLVPPDNTDTQKGSSEKEGGEEDKWSAEEWQEWKREAKLRLANTWNFGVWQNVNLWMVKKTATAKSCTFPVISYKGVHLPPVELALAPAGTKWIIIDETMHVATYYLGKRYGSFSAATVADSCRDSPYLFYDSSLGGFGSGFLRKTSHRVIPVTCKVIFPSKEVMEKDTATRLCLEKTFWNKDEFNRPIKIMELPTMIGGYRVYWDLVVRVYPGLRSDPKTKIGRWMPAVALSDDRLARAAPRLILLQDDPKEGDNLKKVEENTIYRDEEGLLVDGHIKTSSEEMASKVASWRKKAGLPDINWQGGGQLYMEVPLWLTQTGLPEPVTVRVVLRLRTQPKG